MNRRTNADPVRAASLTPLRGLILLVLVLFGFWMSRNADPPPERPAPPPAVATNVEETGDDVEPEAPTPAESKVDEAPRSQIPNMTIRDLEGEIAFRGTVDVQPTLDRIDAGKRLEFRNDGSTFQNREGRLPRKPSGYYKEYVHPTLGVSGPGPQRVVAGEQGEAYYTPDHYRTFRRIR